MYSNSAFRDKMSLIIFFLLLSIANSFSQDLTKDFEIILPTYKVPNSNYKKISFLDSRDYKKQIGLLSIGPLRNQDARLVLKAPFTTRLTSVLNSLIDSTAKEGELLFQLRRFNYAEPRGTRYCNLSAELYSSAGGRYQRISAIDTIIVVSGYDITKPLTILGSKMMTDLIANSLLMKPFDSTYYSIAEVEKMDSIEKRKIPVYNATNYVDG